MFFALWPDHARQAALANATRDVVQACGGRAVPPENFHLTLAFVGAVPEASVGKVEAIGDQVAAEAARVPVQLTMDVIEYWKKAKVVCATAREPHSADAGLADTLAMALKSRLTAVGFTPDLKPFRTHVTLARKIAHPIQSVGIHPVLWSFTDFALVDSRTESTGPVYTVLQTFPVGVRKSSDRR